MIDDNVAAIFILGIYFGLLYIVGKLIDKER